MSPSQVRDAVDGFAARYVQDWDAWITAPAPARPELFGRILRRWQATRPHAMRRVVREARHGPPYLEDLLAQSASPVRELEGLSLLTVRHRSRVQSEALDELWHIFTRLAEDDCTSCVGITKATLLVTNGRLGPALDSQVRNKLRVYQPTRSGDWLHILEEVGADISAFESAHGALSAAVPRRFASVPYGRLYDMALGPR